jgi:hypothetical protein
MNTSNVICYLNGFFTNTYDETIVLNKYQILCILNVVEDSTYDEFSHIVDHIYKNIREEINIDYKYWADYIQHHYRNFEKLTCEQVLHILEGFLDNKQTTTKPIQVGDILFTRLEACYFLEQCEKCDHLGEILLEFYDMLNESVYDNPPNSMLNITQPIITLFN